MDKIESTQNKQVKQWKKLLTRKGRKKQEKYIIEGSHLIEEAKKANTLLDTLLIREDKTEEFNAFIDEKTILVSPEVANELSDAVTNQGILAILPIQEEKEAIQKNKPILLIDEVQDPGNMGTLIRSADAAGFGGVIIGEGSVDLYNPKTLRSAQGSHFHISILHAPLNEWIEPLQAEGIDVFGTALDEKTIDYRTVQATDVFGLMVGNEGNGVKPEFLEKTTSNLYIPIKGQAESLNVAVAASILMFALIP